MTTVFKRTGKHQTLRIFTKFYVDNFYLYDIAPYIKHFIAKKLKM